MNTTIRILLLRTLVIICASLVLSSTYLSAQDCLEYPEIEGSECAACTPEGWSPISGTSPDLIPDDGSWPGGGCTIEALSGESPGGGNMSMFVSQGGYQEGMTTTMSGLNTGQEYGFGLYWEMVQVMNCGFWEGGDLVIILDGEEYTYSGAEEWEFIEICFTPSSSSIDIELHIEGDGGSGAGVIVVDSPSCEEVTPCCPLVLELNEESYDLCPGEEIVFDAFYDNAEGDVSIEWTSDPDDGVDYLDDVNIINPRFLVDDTGNFEEESYIFTVLIEDDNCEKSLELEVNVGNSLIPEFEIYLCEAYEDPDFPLISLNNFTGTWTGNFNIDQLGGTVQEYTFTLDPGQDNCLEEWTFEIPIDLAVEASFDIPLEYCELDDTRYRLDNESEEGIEGEWNENRIIPDELGEGVHVFTFFPYTDEFCSFPLEIEIEVYEADSLSFDMPTSFCISGDSLILPDASLEMIQGEWEEDIIYFDEIGEFSIEFVPEDNFDCYHAFIYTYSVTQSVSSSFDLPDTICRSLGIYEFDETSLEGYTGIWEPQFVDLDTLSSNIIVAEWLPTSTDQNCLSPYSASIVVQDSEVLSFIIPDTLCQFSGTFDLPDTSLSGIEGKWNTNVINTDSLSPSFVYLSFESNDNKCSALYLDSVYIQAPLVPEFTLPFALCQNQEEITLPMLSENGISGSWNIPVVDPSSFNDSLEVAFTPDNPESCYEAFEFTFYIDELLEPEFELQDNLCFNEILAFPSISSNGISGSWETASLDPSQLGNETEFENVFTPDDMDCYSQVSVTVGILNFDQIVLESMDPSSCSSSDATITINGSSSNMEFSIDDGMNWTDQNSFTGLSSNDYIVLARSVLDTLCIEEFSVSINSTEGARILDLNLTDVSNCIDRDGSVECMAEGINLEFSIDNGQSWQVSNIFTDLPSGNYEVIVRSNGDDNCSDSRIFEILAFEESKILDIEIENPTDCDNDDARILVSATGIDLEYSIDLGQSWQTDSLFTDLTPGNYTVQIRSNEAQNCTDEQEISIDENIIPQIIDIATVQLSDCGSEDASIEINTEVYAFDLLFSIDNGDNWQESNSFTDLGHGNYTIVVQDPERSNCSVTQEVLISELMDPQLDDLIITQPSHCLSSDASIELVTDRTDLEFSIDDGQSWQTENIFDMLPEGDYRVIIRDQAHISCTESLEFTLTNPPCPCPDLEIIFTVQDVDCLNPNSGWIEIISVEGMETNLPFEIVWSNGLTGLLIQDLTEDWHSYEVFYDNNCIYEDSIYVDSYDPVDFNLISFDQDCQGLGSIEITNLTGGTGQFQYSIDGFEFQESNLFFNLTADEYQIVVEDLFNCGGEGTTVINDNSDLKLELNPVIPIEQGESTILNPLISESSLDKFEWSPSTGILNPGELVAEVAPQETTEYTLTIYFGDCIEIRSVIVEVIDKRDLYLANIFSPNNIKNRYFFIQSPNDIDITVQSFQIYDRWGNKVFENKDFEPNIEEYGWDGYFNDAKAEIGVYVYLIKYLRKGEAMSKLGSISLIR